MKRPGNLFKITLADFVVRSGYQMGKTPVLPIFAAALGATDIFLGLIVSVSTLTGMLLKPAFGLLSDRWGRRWWLFGGTLFFAGVPFLYGWVETPAQLFGLRLIHGLATAIYGPVTLAFVAEQGREQRAERLGYFGMARHGGYIVGPAVGGWLLLEMDPVGVLSLVGLLSALALVPVVLLEESVNTARTIRPSFRQQVWDALQSGARTPAIWLAGGLEFTLFIALYAVRAFLPLHALSLGLSVALVGSFFAIQEVAHLALRGIGGRIGDRLGYLTAISLGMVLLAVFLVLLTFSASMISFAALAVLAGSAQALVFPATVALASDRVHSRHLGAGMGLIGTLKNAGKVVGPILGGVLLQWLDFAPMLWCMGVLLLAGTGAALWWRALRRRRTEGQPAPITLQPVEESG